MLKEQIKISNDYKKDNIPVKVKSDLNLNGNKEEAELKISVSIVTYNNSSRIANVLNSLLNISNIMNVFVVDNNSSDDTVNIIENNFPEVKLIKSPKNIGYGAGHNLAIKNINSDYHIIINPDVTVKDDQIQKMLFFMEKHKNVVILTPKVMNPDGTEQFLPKLYPRFKYLIGGRFENRGEYFYKLRSEYTLRDKKITKPINIGFCTGCFMLCRTSALKKCGGFDERYFLYFEDADLTREMKKYGKTVYVPGVHVIHEWQRENARSGRAFSIILQSMIKYLWKWK